MKLKTGVRLDSLSTQALLGMFVADQCYRDAGAELVVTSVNDGKHMGGSKHYRGDAFDCRTVTAGINQAKAQKIADAMKKNLGADYDVVVESDHIHCEWDKKQPEKLSPA